jgi:MSHA biogenesis protein MshL
MTFRLLLPAAVLTLASSCAHRPASVAPRTEVHLEPLRSAPEPIAPLPSLPSLSGDAALADGRSSQRLITVSAVNQDLSAVVRELAATYGLQYQIDPSVQGLVNTRLRNATLSQALAAVVPQGATYQIDNGVIRIAAARLMTRIFTLDYVALARFGTASTVIQRRLGATGGGVSGIGNSGSPGGVNSVGNLGGGGLGGGGLGGGADQISAVSVADAWEEIRVASEALVFDAPAAGQPTPAPQVPTGAGSALGSIGRPYSRVAQDGRRLIINPIAGTITVTAFPAQLEQLDLFIKTFEASIQRQVLIEAKIVEVNLDRSFEFGIDWRAVVNIGSGSIGITSVNPGTVRRPPRSPDSSSTGNIEFTLRGGAGQITAVLNALDTQGDVRVLSSPRVSALNNQRAVFDVTTGEIVFNVNQTIVPGALGGNSNVVTTVTPQQVNVGIVLDVLPQIGADNVVTMNIRPVVTSVARTASFTGPDGIVVQAPVIDTRESDTMARLRAGETIIIGGLMQTRREKQRSGVPGLMDIPLLGKLFTSYSDVERKAELVIFLTPTIIAGQPAASR